VGTIDSRKKIQFFWDSKKKLIKLGQIYLILETLPLNIC
jgi:hypothetical protein